MRTRLLATAAVLVALLSVAAVAGAALGTRFSDVPASHPFVAEIEQLADACVVNGYPDGTFRPGANVTRQALSAMLARGLPALLHDAGNDVEVVIGTEVDVASVTIEVTGGPSCERHVRIDGNRLVWLAGPDYTCPPLSDSFVMSVLTVDGQPVNGAPASSDPRLTAYVTLGPGTHTVALSTTVSGGCTGKVRLWGEVAAEVFAVGQTDPVVYPPVPG